MTVSYTSKVTTSTAIGCFLKLLARWKGGVYKIVWADLVLFLTLYYILNLSYVFAMSTSSKDLFVKIVNYCSSNANLIPVSFVLGFYVSIVYTRWWNQFQAIPSPDSLASLIAACVKGQDERARIVRRTIVRYACVAFTLTLAMTSSKVKKRFPTLKHLVDAGLLSRDEKKAMEDLDGEYPNYSKNWLPLAWAANVTTRAKHEGIIRDDASVRKVLRQIEIFKAQCAELLAYDWISIPLVYTQVVTIAVYSYFFITVLGAQSIDSVDTVPEISYLRRIVFSFPLFPVLEFFFYVGWLKVAETLINPFGEDDDDFEVVWMIDRNIQVCYLLVDKIHQQHPKLMKDYYWLQTAPDVLPFTVASQQYMDEIPVQSAQNLKIEANEQDIVVPESRCRPGIREKRSFWNTLWRPFVKKSNDRGYYLRKVTLDDEETFEEINTYEDAEDEIGFRINHKAGCEQNIEEFEELRMERLEKQKEKLMKFIELLKMETNRAEARRILDEIIK